jgi:hypothetical protein
MKPFVVFVTNKDSAEVACLRKAAARAGGPNSQCFSPQLLKLVGDSFGWIAFFSAKS